jgi:hypothetical protein
LLEALADLRRDRYRRPALAWIKSNERHIGSFTWICHCLNLDCEAVRGKFASTPVEVKNDPPDDPTGTDRRKIIPIIISSAPSTSLGVSFLGRSENKATTGCQRQGFQLLK